MNLIKSNIYGSINGRTCTDGIKQIEYLKEGYQEESQTVFIESLLNTLVIDAYEG